MPGLELIFLYASIFSLFCMLLAKFYYILVCYEVLSVNTYADFCECQTWCSWWNKDLKVKCFVRFFYKSKKIEMDYTSWYYLIAYFFLLRIFFRWVLLDRSYINYFHYLLSFVFSIHYYYLLFELPSNCVQCSYWTWCCFPNNPYCMLHVYAFKNLFLLCQSILLSMLFFFIFFRSIFKYWCWNDVPFRAWRSVCFGRRWRGKRNMV